MYGLHSHIEGICQPVLTNKQGKMIINKSNTCIHANIKRIQV